MEINLLQSGNLAKDVLFITKIEVQPVNITLSTAGLKSTAVEILKTNRKIPTKLNAPGGVDRYEVISRIKKDLVVWKGKKALGGNQ